MKCLSLLNFSHAVEKPQPYPCYTCAAKRSTNRRKAKKTWWEMRKGEENVENTKEELNNRRKHGITTRKCREMKRRKLFLIYL